MPTQYQPGIPTGTVNLDQDYINIRNNFTQLNTTYGTDHVAYDVVENNGFHRQVSMVPVSTTSTNPPDNDPVVPPSTDAGIGKLFNAITNDGYATNTALYFLQGPSVGLGNVLQLTSNILPRLNTRGYTFLPGGIILQWGTTSVSGDGSSGTVTFTTGGGISFANAVWALAFSLKQSSDPNSASAVSYSGLTTTKFDWFYRGSNNISNFSWFAIGS